MEATYTTNFGVCESSGYCGWFAHAYQYPASQPCQPDGSNLTYVGGIHESSGTEVATDDFLPKYDAGRLCLYGYHAGNNYFVAEATYVYFHGPPPSIRRAFVVGDQSVSFYFPKSCLAGGRNVELRVAARTKRSLLDRKPPTRIARVTFKLDRASRTDRSAPWTATFTTGRLALHSRHTAKAKIQFKLRNSRRKLVRTVSGSFRIC